MATVFKASAFGDASVPFDTEPTSYNPVVTWGLQGGEPCIVVTPTAANFFGKSPIGSPATLSFRFAITLSGYPSASNPIFAPLTSGGASAWRIRLSSTGTLILDNSSNTAVVTSGAIPLNTTYLVKVRMTATTVQMQLFNAIRGGTQVGSTLSGTNTFGLADNIRIGQASATPIIPPYKLQHVLFTDTDEWLPDPAVPTTVVGKTYGIIGDSLTAMSGANGEYIRTHLISAGIPPRNVYFWGVGGKRMTVPDTAGSNNGNANAKTSMQNIQDAKNVYGTIDHWIVALGTNDRPQNDATVNGYIDTLLAAIGVDPEITWIGLTSKGSASADDIRLNGLIQAKLTARGNAEFADWNTYIRSVDGGANPSPLWVTTDTTHMTSFGYETERAPYYVDHMLEASTQPWDAVYVGGTLADAVYVGSELVWSA